jgi:hypothetical protein
MNRFNLTKEEIGNDQRVDGNRKNTSSDDRDKLDSVTSEKKSFDEKEKMVRKLCEQFSSYISVVSFFLSCFVSILVVIPLVRIGENAGMKMDWAFWLFMPIFFITYYGLILWIGKKFKYMYEKKPNESLKSKYKAIIKKENFQITHKKITDRIFTWGIILSAAILFATNPSKDKFLEFIDQNSIGSPSKYHFKNLLIFSYYRSPDSDEFYLGVLNNIFDVSFLEYKMF